MKGGEGEDAPLPIALLEEDFGLAKDLPSASRWINPEGSAASSRGQIEMLRRAFFDGVSTLARLKAGTDATEGKLLHDLGTTLRLLRGCSAWKTVGIESWEQYCLSQLRISRRHADRLVAFAGAVTAEQAPYGLRKCSAGLALVERLGLASLTELLQPPGGREPEAWAELVGEPVRFETSSAVRLERLLKGGAKAELPAGPPSARVRSTVTRRTAIIDDLAKKHPALEKLEVKSYADRGVARIKHKPASQKQEIQALAKLYAALGRDE
jgi:hypothetical protein